MRNDKQAFATPFAREGGIHQRRFFEEFFGFLTMAVAVGDGEDLNTTAELEKSPCLLLVCCLKTGL